MLLSLFGSLALAAAPAIDDDAVASLTRPLAEGFARPDEQAVTEYWTRSGQRATTIPMFKAEVRQGRHAEEAVFALRDGEPTLLFVVDPEVEDEVSRWLREGKLQPSGTGWRVGKTTVEPTWHASEAPIDSGLWSAWTYVGVLAEFQGPLYTDPGAGPEESVASARDVALATAVEAGEVAGIVQALDAVLAEPYAENDWRWERVIRAAEGIADAERALAAYQRYRPYGRCSMDTRPEELAREYSDACFAQGMTGCAVQLQIRAMDYWASRRGVWSSYGEAASVTGVNRLEAMGLDTPTFLLGLALDFDGVDDVGISLQRLGRAVHESTEREATVAAFDRVARDPAADEHSRLVATIVLNNAHGYAGTTLDPAGLSATGLAWVRHR